MIFKNREELCRIQLAGECIVVRKVFTRKSQKSQSLTWNPVVCLSYYISIYYLFYYIYYWLYETFETFEMLLG